MQVVYDAHVNPKEGTSNALYNKLGGTMLRVCRDATPGEIPGESMTQDEYAPYLSQLLGMKPRDRNWLSFFENGRRAIPFSVVCAAADAAHIDLETLVSIALRNLKSYQSVQIVRRRDPQKQDRVARLMVAMEDQHEATSSERLLEAIRDEVSDV